MHDFLITAFAVTVGILLAIGLYDLAVQGAHSCSAARKARQAKEIARRSEEQRLRNRRIRLDFVEDGWLPPAGWSINDEGDWVPGSMEVYLGGKACPASPPEERLEELREEQDSYW